ncbi:MAG TPA: gephyrin-like molybdotransferase Glp [Thermoanaerobaculia bacterium]|nr:gephyrin-like molybdotransferase Glp [Thermoanaerobaculia bacterium]
MSGFQAPRAGERMLSVEEARESVLRDVPLVGTEEIALIDALGRVLREDVRAVRDVPLRDNSAMDGYAVRSEDLAGASPQAPVRLSVIEDVPAGRVPTRRVEKGAAVRIMTGALLPEGSDTVVPVELTDAGSETVAIVEHVREGSHVRRRAEDMKEGAIVLRAGSRIGPAEIGVLASVQAATVRVARRPSVAILSTGDEIVEVDQAWEPGKVVNSNSYSLAALAREAGAAPRLMGVVKDTLEETKNAIGASLESDFILSSGGVSVGAFDFVKDALDALGAETSFWQVAMKPGRPLVFSRLGGKLYFGLPGNPVSCMVSFLLFVGPAVRKAMGQAGPLVPPTVRARTEGRLRSRGDRRQYLRARVVARDGEMVAIPMRVQGSGVSTSMVGANGFCVLDAGVTEIAPGEMVDVVIFGGIEPA